MHVENRRFHQVPVVWSIKHENENFRGGIYKYLHGGMHSSKVVGRQSEVNILRKYRSLVRDFGTRGKTSFSASSHTLIIIA